MSEVDGATLIARSLKQQGIDHLFGVVRFPFYVAEATRQATFGRPGAAYLDMPDDIITGKCDDADVVETYTIPAPPRFQAPPENVEAALAMLERAERPLVIVGKGMAW